MKSYKYSVFTVKFGAMAYSAPMQTTGVALGNKPERVAVLVPALKNPGVATL
jgi:hypothetical protein